MALFFLTQAILYRSDFLFLFLNFFLFLICLLLLYLLFISLFFSLSLHFCGSLKKILRRISFLDGTWRRVAVCAAPAVVRWDLDAAYGDRWGTAERRSGGWLVASLRRYRRRLNSRQGWRHPAPFARLCILMELLEKLCRVRLPLIWRFLCLFR